MNEHLAIFLPDLRGGGAERSMVNLSTGLVDLGCRVDMVLAKAKGPFLSMVDSRVRVVDLGMPHAMVSLPALGRYLRTERPAALLSALNQANVVAAWSRRLVRHDARVIISLRNTLSMEFDKSGSLNQKFLPYFAKRFYPWADVIVSVSDGAADDFAQLAGIDRRRIQTIYNPVVSDELLRQAEEPVDHPWFRPGEPPVILAAGRLSTQKDYGTLVRAFAKVRAGRECRLVILGEGELHDSLVDTAKKLGVDRDFALPGFQSNPYAFMSKAGVFVLSSLFEGLPGVLIQALASGTPVVATDCPSGPREVLQSGKYGPLVPVGDVDAIAAAIDDVLGRRAAGIDMTPPCECWAPFLVSTASRRYAETMLGTALPEAMALQI